MQAASALLTFWQRIFSTNASRLEIYSQPLLTIWQKLLTIWQKLLTIWQKLLTIWQKLLTIWQKLLTIWQTLKGNVLHASNLQPILLPK
jgi:hypothetical protein